MTEREFVHITDISFFDELKKKHVIDDSAPPSDGSHRDKKRTRSPFRWSKRPYNSGGVNTNNNGGSSEPNSPAKDGSKLSSDDLLPPGNRTVRSTTLPSEMLTGGSVGSPTSVKKSSKKKSKSITSFFQVSTLPSAFCSFCDRETWFNTQASYLCKDSAGDVERGESKESSTYS